MTVPPPTPDRSETEASASRSLLIGIGLMALGGLCIGYAPIGLRLSVAEGFGPQATAFWRFLFSVPLVLLLIRMTGRWPGKPNRYAVLAGVFFAFDIGFWHVGLTMTTVANATFIVNLGNAGVGLTAWLFLKERPSGIWFIGAFIALAGASLLSLGGVSVEGSGALRGDLLALGAAVMVSGYLLCAKIARRDMNALDVLFWTSLAETLVALPIVLASGETLAVPSFTALWAPLSIAMLAQVVGQGCIIAGVGRLPAALAGVMILVQPVAAASISWVLFGEVLTSLQVLGAGIVLAGIALAQVRRRKRAALQTEALS